MGRIRITKTPALAGGTEKRIKQLQRLEKQYQEWKSEFTIDFCFTTFMVVQRERNNSEYTIYNYKCFYRKYTKFLEECFNASPKTTSMEIFETEPHQAVFMEWLKRQGLQQSSINAFLRNMKSFCFWAVEEGYIDSFKCPIKQVPTKVKEVYTVQELEKLMVKPAVTDFYNFRAYCLISLMLNTGARRRTLSEIRIKDLEVEEGYINFNTTKTNKVVRLGLERKTRRDLAEWLQYWRLDKGAEEDDFLFCNEFGGQLSPNSITYTIARYNKEHGVEKTSVHLFRHTFAKMWITSGGDIITLAKVLTHSELEMVQRYSNLYGGDVKREIEQHSAISQMKQKGGKTLKNQKGER